MVGDDPLSRGLPREQQQRVQQQQQQHTSNGCPAWGRSAHLGCSSPLCVARLSRSEKREAFGILLVEDGRGTGGENQSCCLFMTPSFSGAEAGGGLRGVLSGTWCCGPG